MRLFGVRKSALLVAVFVLTTLAGGGASTARRTLPNPVLVFAGYEFNESGGKQWTRYRYTVDNRAEYPDSLFAAAPSLPPCGSNTNASRTWVDIYDQSGKRLNGFCALKGAKDLTQLWFALERDAVPPSWVYVEMTDRQTNTKYKSNLADLTL
ncbi:MAG: hypothetical protein LC785_17830 [Acidobacteria bacterium]|nr:hypothetical protein [Acidobacteriota bacterium]